MPKFLKEISYRGQSIKIYIYDGGQEFAIINDNKENIYLSIVDAKQAINGNYYFEYEYEF